MLCTSETIVLSSEDRLAKGSLREVYRFPGQPDLLVKVRAVGKLHLNPGFFKRTVWRILPDSRFRNTLKELESEAKAAIKLGASIQDLPMPRMHGVVHTNRGTGLVVERIKGINGELAENMGRVFAKGGRVPQNAIEDLNRFVRTMFELQVVARDIGTLNIVYGMRGSKTGFYLVDGYGERNVVPLRTLSRRLNDRSLNRQFSRIAAETGLVWHSDRRAFSS